MVIYSNGLISLDYQPTTDILMVELPNASQFGISELESSLDIIARNIINYDIKRLLLDSSNVLVDQIEDDVYAGIVESFIFTLSKSRLQKLARVNTKITTADKRTAQVTSQATEKLNIALQIKLFNNRTDGLNWLLSK